MKKLSRKEFIDELNLIIEEQGGNPVDSEKLLADSGMDSFSYAFFWAYTEEKFPMFDVKYVNNIDYSTYKIKDMVEHYENS